MFDFRSHEYRRLVRFPRHVTNVFIVLSLVVVTVGGRSLWGPSRTQLAEELLSDVPQDKMEKEFARDLKILSEPKVIEVTDGVFVAVGFALANSILIEAPDGAIIVDVTESMESAREVYKAFRNFTSSPIKAIIYTHSHADHVNGAMAFVDDPNNAPDVWAHRSFPKHRREVQLLIGEIAFVRAMRQFGALLPSTVNAGIGPRLKFNNNFSFRPVAPNKFLNEEEKDVSIAGLDVKLVFVPGETNDQIAVWIPSKRLLLCADDYYKAFPNLYAIRGSSSRDLLQWVSSIDKMRLLQPEHLVPSHTLPITGEREINNILTNYRDAIQFVHDQTLRYMNKGLKPDEIVEKIKLPSVLENDVHLRQMYGTVAWSVRGVFSSYLGWFSGRPEELNPLSNRQRGKRMMNLIGSDKIISAAKAALLDKDPQWALELTSFVLTSSDSRDLRNAKGIRISAMKALASQQSSANGRNYYLTSVLEESGILEITKPKGAQKDVIKEMPIKYLLRAFPPRFNAEKCFDVHKKAVFEMKDSKEFFTLVIRNSVLEITDGNSNDADYKVVTDSTTFRGIIANDISTWVAILTGRFSIEGGFFGFKKFMGCIETPD